jgi:uncharacterized integral membrane protein
MRASDGDQMRKWTAFRIVVGAILLSLFLTFAFQNGDEVTVELLGSTREVSLIWLLIVTGLIGMILGALLAMGVLSRSSDEQ